MSTPQKQVPQNLQDVLDKLPVAVGKVSAFVADLKSQVKTGMTPAEVDSVTAGLTSVVDNLNAISANPAQPPPPLPAQAALGGKKP